MKEQPDSFITAVREFEAAYEKVRTAYNEFLASVSCDKVIPFTELVQAAATAFNVDYKAIMDGTRQGNTSLARWSVCWTLREVYHQPHSVIERYLHQHHTASVYGVKKLKDRVDTDKTAREMFDKYKQLTQKDSAV